MGEHVAGIGEAYEPYKEITIKEDIGGETLLDIDDDDLQELGAQKNIHRKKILKKITGAKSASASGAAPEPASALAPASEPAPAQVTAKPQGD